MLTDHSGNVKERRRGRELPGTRGFLVSERGRPGEKSQERQTEKMLCSDRGHCAYRHTTKRRSSVIPASPRRRSGDALALL